MSELVIFLLGLIAGAIVTLLVFFIVLYRTAYSAEDPDTVAMGYHYTEGDKK